MQLHQGRCRHIMPCKNFRAFETCRWTAGRRSTAVRTQTSWLKVPKFLSFDLPLFFGIIRQGLSHAFVAMTVNYRHLSQLGVRDEKVPPPSCAPKYSTLPCPSAARHQHLTSADVCSILTPRGSAQVISTRKWTCRMLPAWANELCRCL